MSAPFHLRRMLFIATLLLAGARLGMADEAGNVFLWEQANARMATARKPAEFLEAARCYNRLVAAGVRNGPLFSNLGTALLLAGDAPNARAALERAERYAGSSPETQTNLRLARALQSGQPEVDEPWERVLFFWHFDQPLRLRIVLVLACWALLWCGIVLRLLVTPRAVSSHASSEAGSRLRTLGGTCILFGAFLMLAFGASALISGVRDFRDEQGWNDRIFISHEPVEAAR